MLRRDHNRISRENSSLQCSLFASSYHSLKCFEGVQGGLSKKSPLQKGGRCATAPALLFCHFIFCTARRIFFPVFSIACAVFLATRLALLLITTPIAPATDAAVRIPAATIVAFFIFIPPCFVLFLFLPRKRHAIRKEKRKFYAVCNVFCNSTCICH